VRIAVVGVMFDGFLIASITYLATEQPLIIEQQFTRTHILLLNVKNEEKTIQVINSVSSVTIFGNYKNLN
jgi:hypothetical protein